MEDNKTFISLENLQEFKGLYDTQLGENYYNKDEVDRKVVPYQPFPADFVTNETTLVLINSIKAQNYPAGSTFLGGVTLTDMPFSGNAEVEVYIYPNNVVYLTLRSSNVSPYIWECNSHSYRGWEAVGKAYADANFLKKDNTTSYTPTANYHPSTKKYVDDGLLGKLTYKGHVNSVEDLPSTGQPSGNVISPNIVIDQSKYNTWKGTSKSNFSDIYTAMKTDKTSNGHDKAAYVAVLGSSTSAYSYISTDYPEIIQGVTVCYTDASTMHANGYFVFFINASEDKPAYLYGKYREASPQRFIGVTYLDGTGTNINNGQLTKPAYCLIQQWPLISMTLVGNVQSIKMKIPTTSQLYYSSNNYGAATSRAYVFANSFTHTYSDGGSYNTNNNMFFISFDSDERLKFIRNETNVVANELYSVGDKYELYRSNNVPAWEHWAQSNVDLSNYLAKDNTTSFTPSGDYNPSTKKYVDTSISNKATTLLSNIAPAYNNTQTYNEGAYVIYNSQLYVCNTDIQTAEDFDSTKWDTTTVAEILGNIKSLLGGI